MKPKRTWILIADGARARVLEKGVEGEGLHEVKGWDLRADHRPSHEIMSDRPSRSYDSAGSARHAMEPRTDPHRELKRTFAHLLAERLEEHLAKHEFERLVLVAPPQMLGDLRNALSKTVRALVTAEVAKDLVKVPDAEVAGHLKDAIRI